MIKKILSLTIFTLLITSLSLAAEIKTIQLKDGSIIKGKITSLSEGIYTIYSEHFGKISLKEEEIQQISSGNITPQPKTLQKEEIKDYTQKMQAQMMADPEVLQEMQRLAEDENIQKILADPSFMNAVFSYDPEAIMNNEATQQLMENPKMQQMMELLGKKYQPTE